MTLLSDRLAAIMRDSAFSNADHRRLDGAGQAIVDPSRRNASTWSWTVSVDSDFVDITANTKHVVATREAALEDARELFDQLAPLVGTLRHSSLGAQNVFDRVNEAIVGWVGSVAISARWAPSAARR
ncbi:hypothetical protein ABZS66_41095 [Dactylosporangium sp. NPDC005572]|uniref:hypothetical protein n=1 Tax=Dactylosporangium sp. NPDC005572 TaxID=3156889 RepID=UPI0033B1F8B9